LLTSFLVERENRSRSRIVIRLWLRFRDLRSFIIHRIPVLFQLLQT
jgi:hypothetical protein